VKKQIKKLTLSKDTITRLESTEVSEVRGGTGGACITVYTDCYTNCDCPAYG
jgi:hypothetical protein